MNLRLYREPEMGPIRTPSEDGSLPIRVNRNCPWNGCLFCPVYKGKKFSQRSVEEVERDIDYWVAEDETFESVFLQDSDAPRTETKDLIEILEYIKQNMPSVKRITSYARASTIAQKTSSELASLHEAGLSGLYIGLESGCNRLLSFMRKGLSQETAIEAGLKVKEAGIELNFFVLIGLAGKLNFDGEEAWRMHALETAKVLNETNPDCIRFRTLYIFKSVALYKFLERGEFEYASEENLLQEQRLLLENLDVTSSVESVFVTNFPIFEGQLPRDREKILKEIDRAPETPGFQDWIDLRRRPAYENFSTLRYEDI